ncbi:MAG: hypothetical protein COV07_02110 [Candidatus Vogelbacteria bacterium CG10_big_fil_rev_8_21_14_0_10_45_14]|uniref:Phosphatidate cytidylyltransferase n=1 Tax=Candidatus Vogelbacteria bacterium CG10_big_fil_rev_8_21_14_0_10_45_14 TaxID=1975042 RepID=A0A2H0RK65_9BACT|nr:MAG: hypothetical protein COV07_02110 [Candidatus Vogelbacteria bacterium CG10_big_fil_rev_8_21_14_0_10_45_14]
MENFFIFISTLAVFFLLLVLVELVRHHGKLEDYVARKLAHGGAGFLFLLLPLHFDAMQIVVVAVGFLVGLFISEKSGKSSIHRKDRKSVGEYFYPIALALSAILLLPYGDWRAYAFAVAVLAFGDGMAELVGRQWGVHRIGFVSVKKTWEGSLALFITTLIAFLVISPIFSIQIILAGLLVSVVITYAEMEFGHGLDNLVLPLLAGGLFILTTSLL